MHGASAVALAVLSGSRWQPVKRGAVPYGLVVLKDLTPDEPGEAKCGCMHFLRSPCYARGCVERCGADHSAYNNRGIGGGSNGSWLSNQADQVAASGRPLLQSECHTAGSLQAPAASPVVLVIVQACRDRNCLSNASAGLPAVVVLPAVEYASSGPGSGSGTGAGGDAAAAGAGGNPGDAAAKQEQEPPPPPTFGG
jgi:hypothetical protein